MDEKEPKIEFTQEQLAMLYLMVNKCELDYTFTKNELGNVSNEFRIHYADQLALLEHTLKEIPKLYEVFNKLITPTQFNKPNWNEPR